MTSLAVVTAAGSSERFGGPKLLVELAGVPLLERTVRSLLDGGVGRVVVVVRPGDTGPLTADPRVAVAVNQRPERGMFSSIQAALAAAEGDPVLLLPGDMPFVRPQTVGLILAAYGSRRGIVSPRYRGKRGHPVALPAVLRARILAAADDLTLHDVIRAYASERTDLDVDDPGILRDVDVPEDLASGGGYKVGR